MKKTFRMVLLGLALTLALAPSAQAQTTAVLMDGKVYTFSGDQTAFEADGMTFLLEGDTIRIRQEGKADRVLPLASSMEATVVENITQTDVAAASETAVMTEEIAAVDVASATTAVSEGTMESVALDASATFEPYTRFGLRYEPTQDALSYQGQRVRIFSDAYPVGDNASCAIEHFDPNGIVDVEAQRDLSQLVYYENGGYDPSGVLTGLRALSSAEFAARDLSSWLAPAQQVTATSGEPFTAAEKQALYAPYAAYGLTYDAQADQLLYQGQQVRRFLDVKQSNGEGFSSGRFKGSMTQMSYDDGEVDISIVRDFDTPDANGDGMITGILAEPIR